MPNKNITLSVDSEAYEKYADYCKKNGLVISKRFEMFIKKELKENNHEIWYSYKRKFIRR